MKFISLEEHNDHEGECWRFWLQLDGNEDAIEHLRAAIAGADAEETYDLAPATDAVSEPEVDVLVKHTGCGYMDYEQKYVGTLTLPDNADVHQLLYKGRIDECFIADA